MGTMPTMVNEQFRRDNLCAIEIRYSHLVLYLIFCLCTASCTNKGISLEPIGTPLIPFSRLPLTGEELIFVFGPGNLQPGDVLNFRIDGNSNFLLGAVSTGDIKLGLTGPGLNNQLKLQSYKEVFVGNSMLTGSPGDYSVQIQSSSDPAIIVYVKGVSDLDIECIWNVINNAPAVPSTLCNSDKINHCQLNCTSAAKCGKSQTAVFFDVIYEYFIEQTKYYLGNGNIGMSKGDLWANQNGRKLSTNSAVNCMAECTAIFDQPNNAVTMLAERCVKEVEVPILQYIPFSIVVECKDDFFDGTKCPQRICILDRTCYAGNQAKVRDAASNQCIDIQQCSAFWKCKDGPSAGCGGGTADCVFSPGCSDGVQQCFDGYCTTLATCTDRIKYTGYSQSPNLNQCNCANTNSFIWNEQCKM